jgi:hypothetical protein
MFITRKSGPVNSLVLPYVQVRDYTFSPDTGQIDTIRYDSLGQPLVPESLMTVWEVSVEQVQSVYPQYLVLRPGAQQRAVLISDGFIGQLYRGVQVSPPFSDCSVSFTLHS